MSGIWICDVNGVLVDSKLTVYQAFSATATRYRFSFTERDFQRAKDRPLLDAYRVLDPGSDPYVLREFHLCHVRDRIANVRAFPGVREVLSAARAAGIRVGAATADGETAEAALVDNGLYPFIDCLVTQQEVKRAKPHPDLLLRILRLFGVDRHIPDEEDVVCVGDTASDIEAGRAAGVRTIGVTYGVSLESEIRAAEPDYIITSFDEMRQFLSRSMRPSAASQHVTPAGPLSNQLRDAR